MTTENSSADRTPADPAYVAEQTGLVVRADVVTEPLEPLAAAARAATMTRAMGALVVFDGVVRDHDGGQSVAGLEYTAHPRVAEFLREVADEVSGRHPRARLWAVHRIGPLRIGESALTVMAAAAHRHDAFLAAEELTDAIKARVPIWKEQALADGGTEWVGL